MATDTKTESQTQTFVARQPIVDAQRRVLGYELLFRASERPTASPPDPSHATARVIVDSLFAIGLDTLVGRRRAFVNVGREVILEGVAAVLPADRVVLELGADVEADEDVLAACRDLRSQGFALAIDDFVLTETTEPLLPLVSYLKVDFQFAGTAAARQQIGAVPRPGGPALVAKRIETQAHFQAAVGEGFAYFQGFFLGEPVVTAGKPIAAAELGRLRTLHALHNPMLSIGQIEELIKSDAPICYQLLRAVNSAASAQHQSVQSIRQALLLIGRDMVRRWVAVWTLAGLGRDVHPELIAMSAVRARCCELLAESVGGEALAAEAFLVGLCSLLDAILGRPMHDVIQAVPLSDDSRAALGGTENRLRLLLNCAVTYERGEWDRAVVMAARAGLNPQELPAAYLRAMAWARDLQHA